MKSPEQFIAQSLTIISRAVKQLRASFACPLGFHPKHLEGGSQANICHCCGAQLVKNPQKAFVATLTDGSTVRVNAVNEYCAGNMIVHGAAGPTRSIKANPGNILSLEQK